METKTYRGEYVSPKARIVDFVMTATLCQTSNWTTETDPEEDVLP